MFTLPTKNRRGLGFQHNLKQVSLNLYFTEDSGFWRLNSLWTLQLGFVEQRKIRAFPKLAGEELENEEVIAQRWWPGHQHGWAGGSLQKGCRDGG